ncbi:sucrose-6-phosphate hydrolase [Corynebacterium atrinae]
MGIMATARPRYHLTAPTGRLNDPNGIFLSGDTLHVYYQKDPAFPFGAKRTGWGHATTTLGGEHALIWQHHPDALYPDAPYDLHGCYSGGAVRDHDGTVHLFYTGNLKVAREDGPPLRQATQNSVTVQSPDGPEGGFYRRHPANPLIDAPAPGFTSHYRDPMITVDPSGSATWRMVLGAQREDETGAVVLYRSDDLVSWDFFGPLTFDVSGAEPGTAPDLIPGGYMWECPNLLTMHDQSTGEDLEVLIICPQGLEPLIDADGTTHYASSDNCGYLVGRLHGTTFEVLRGFSELDFGHQFYAPQVIAENGPDSALMLGWMGLPAQDDTPSVEAEGWVHCLTVPRRLTLSDRTLRQELIAPVELVRENLHDEDVTFVVRDTAGVDRAELAYRPGPTPQLSLSINGDTRTVACPPGDVEIFLDGCALEISAGGGTVCFSSVVFPSEGAAWEPITRA